MWGVILALLASAFFSGMESAYLNLNRFRLELKQKQGTVSALILGRFVRHSDEFLGTILIGNNLALVVYGMFMTPLLEPLLLGWIPALARLDLAMLGLQTLLSSVVVLLVGEYWPKTLFRARADAWAPALARPMLGVYYLLFPFVVTVSKVSRWFINSFSQDKGTGTERVFDKGELSHWLNEQADASEDPEEQEVDLGYFHKALYFSDVKVRACMVPRTELVGVDLDADRKTVLEVFDRSGLSKLLLYQGDMDQVTGYVHFHSVLAHNQQGPFNLRDVQIPLAIVPESMSASRLLKQLTTGRRSMALVVDDLGGTSGIVTVEDLLEEIFGEIQDEHDEPEQVEQVLPHGEFLLSGRLEVDYLNEQYGLGIPSGPYETLGGWVMEMLGEIPQAGTVWTEGPLEIRVEAVTLTRIDLVRIKRLAPVEAD
jgi:CBS domain containing-hemolysin-like protein